MSPINVPLGRELENLIHRKMESGRFASTSEVVHEALRLMDEHDRLQELRKDELRGQIAIGIASLRAGNGTDGEAFFAEMDAGLDALESQESW